MDINQALNDQFDVDPYVDWVLLFLCLIGVCFALVWFVLAWHVIKYLREGPTGRPSDRGPCCTSCLGMEGRVAVAWWVLLSLAAIAFIIGSMAFGLIYPQLYGLFGRFVSVSMPIAQPLLIVCLAALFPLLWIACAYFWHCAREAQVKVRAALLAAFFFLPFTLL